MRSDQIYPCKPLGKVHNLTRVPLRIFAILIVTVFGCRESDLDSQASGLPFTVIDSAGIEIVVSRAAVWSDDEAWSIDLEPSLSIGVPDGDPDYELHEVRGVAKLSDGAILVASREGPLRLYDAQGHHLLSWGGSGSGPGEFQAITDIDVMDGDTIAVLDVLSRRVSLFDANGKLLSETSTPAVNQGEFVALSNGPLLATELAYPRPMTDYIEASSERGTFVRQLLRIISIGRHGQAVDTLLTLEGAEDYLSVSGSGASYRYTSRDYPYARDASWTSYGDRIVAGSNDRVAFSVYAADGSVQQIVRAPILDVDLHSEADHVASLRDAAIGEVASRGVPAGAKPFRLIEAMFESVRLPEVVPRFNRIMASPSGVIWLLPYSIPYAEESEVTAIVFDTMGRLMGEVALPHPQRFQPMEFGNEYVLGLWTDDLGVQYIRTYDIRK